MVDFGDWDMPLHYDLQLDEYHKVRQDAGMLDVSHMLPVDINGDNVRGFLRQLVAIFISNGLTLAASTCNVMVLLGRLLI